MTVFILGAGVMQLPALSLAKELGWTTIAADGNPQAPGAGVCDRFFAIDLKDREGLLAAAREV
ncbi:MAG TPA: carboxylate--amine ligase, partial [Rectinemataceae bacterium]|nr:carboxylate--amine ligase [Rectinemataceae bacterium]